MNILPFFSSFCLMDGNVSDVACAEEEEFALDDFDFKANLSVKCKI